MQGADLAGHRAEAHAEAVGCTEAECGRWLASEAERAAHVERVHGPDGDRRKRVRREGDDRREGDKKEEGDKEPAKDGDESVLGSPKFEDLQIWGESF